MKLIKEILYKVYTREFDGVSSIKYLSYIIRNRSATEPVMLKVHNVKLSFDIWLVLYIYFILYF